MLQERLLGVNRCTASLATSQAGTTGPSNVLIATGTVSATSCLSSRDETYWAAAVSEGYDPADPTMIVARSHWFRGQVERHARSALTTFASCFSARRSSAAASSSFV